MNPDPHTSSTELHAIREKNTTLPSFSRNQRNNKGPHTMLNPCEDRMWHLASRAVRKCPRPCPCWDQAVLIHFSPAHIRLHATILLPANSCNTENARLCVMVPLHRACTSNAREVRLPCVLQCLLPRTRKHPLQKLTGAMPPTTRKQGPLPPTDKEDCT